MTTRFNRILFDYDGTLIIHDKEKDLHLHCILVLNTALSKKQLLDIFPYADIRVQKADNYNAWLYLSHGTKKCIEQGKYRYDVNDIIYHNFNVEYGVL